MIGKALRTDIEIYAGQLDRNPVFLAIMSGRMTRPMVTQYVSGLHYLLTHAPVQLAKARERARALGNEPLAEFFQLKVTEEVGHDAWAENDLRQLHAKPPSRAEVPEEIKRIVQFVDALIAEDPQLYLAYIAFTEYFTVLKGPEWLALLEERCGIPQTAMTAIGKHVELDRDHAEEGFAAMDDVITDPRMLVRMRDALARTATHFDAFCAEIAAPAALPPDLHVSAA